MKSVLNPVTVTSTFVAPAGAELGVSVIAGSVDVRTGTIGTTVAPLNGGGGVTGTVDPGDDAEGGAVVTGAGGATGTPAGDGGFVVALPPGAVPAGAVPPDALPPGCVGGAEGGCSVGGGSGGADPRASDHVHVTVATASPGCSGPTWVRTWVVFDPASCVSVVAASIFGNCHSYTVATRGWDDDGTPPLMN